MRSMTYGFEALASLAMKMLVVFLRDRTMKKTDIGELAPVAMGGVYSTENG